MRRASCSHDDYQLTRQTLPSAFEEVHENGIDVEASSNIIRIKRKYRVCLIFLMILIVFLVIIIDTTVPGMDFLLRMAVSLTQWFKSNMVKGSFVLFAIYLVQTLLGFPGTVLNNLSGYIYVITLGLWKGLFTAFLVSFISLAISSNVSFFVGRSCCRNELPNFFKRRSKYTNAIMLAMQSNPIKFGLLLRISPFLCYSHLNYLFSGLEISLKVFNVLHIGMIPAMCVNNILGAFFGALVFDPSQESPSSKRIIENNQTLAALIITCATLTIFVVVLTFKTKKILQKLDCSPPPNGAKISHRICEKKDEMEEDCTEAACA